MAETNSKEENTYGEASLIASLKNAVDLELESDLLLTSNYLNSYSPKRLFQLGLAVINLIVSNIKNGLGGKTLMELELDQAVKSGDNEIQLGTLRVGDIVRLDRMSNAHTAENVRARKAKDNSSNNEDDRSGREENENSLDAVIIQASLKCITIATEGQQAEEKAFPFYNNTANDNAKVWIVKMSNSVTYKRMISSMSRLTELRTNQKSDIIKYLLGEIDFNIPQYSRLKDSEFFDKGLNVLQKEAISFALASPISIIHGPPGTGKTYTLIELIKQFCLRQNNRILVCGPSNISIDTILERLSPVFGDDDSGTAAKKNRRQARKSNDKMPPEKLIRIGHPARLLPGNLKHSLDILSKTGFSTVSSNHGQILADVEKDIAETLSKIKRSKKYPERKALWSDLKSLKKELRSRQTKVVQDLILGAKVVLSTLHGAGAYEVTSLYKDPLTNLGAEQPLFDTIIIDEVSQSLEPQCWIPFINHIGFKKLIIAGDNMQLPPTVKSKDIQKQNVNGKKQFNKTNLADLEFTLFDRLVAYRNGNNFKVLLDTQYRMNNEIMRFPSRELYEDKLRAHESVANIALPDLVPESPENDLLVPCIWYDTQGGNFPEKLTDDDRSSPNLLEFTGSKYNDMEALVVLQHLQQLIRIGIDPQVIGIISPYQAQVSLLKKYLQSHEITLVEVATVDGFQGREKEVIILSLVRSNELREVGFLKDRRRLNVAMTRPKRQLCVIGDIELMTNCDNRFLADWASYSESYFDIRYPVLDDIAG